MREKPEDYEQRLHRQRMERLGRFSLRELVAYLMHLLTHH